MAGCGSEAPRTPVAADGAAATVPPDTAGDAGYEHGATTTPPVNATLEVTLEGDVEITERQPVNASVPVATYRRSTDAGPSVLAVAASPVVQVVENPPRSGDPLSTLSTGELVTFAQSDYAEPADLAERGSSEVRLLGESTALTTYHGTAVRDGDRVEVAVHVARVEHDGDVVTTVAVHPRAVDEHDWIATLLAAVQH
jgi:hypothetical protein